MGVGIGPESWFTQWMRWFNGECDIAPVQEMPILYSHDEVEMVAQPLRLTIEILTRKIDELNHERKNLFTVKEVNTAIAAAMVAKNDLITRLTRENERYLTAINEARESVTESFVGIPTKNESQSYLSSDDPV